MPRRLTKRRYARLLTAALIVVSTTGMPSPAHGAEEPYRLFGSEPLDDVLAAAATYADCGLNRDQFAALILSPTFPETGADLDESPSPMTMSRWDNQAALYAFGTKSTAYPKAFWHPGIGAWQWDDISGVGLTAGERMDTSIAAGTTARTMINRYCSKINNGATTAAARTYAWGPWYGCGNGRCETIYSQLLVGSTLTKVTRDATTTRRGGVELRTCEVLGASGTFPCRYVDPAKAQGSRDWTAPGFGPAPLSAPFYSYSIGNREHRVWIRPDTGYAVPITASKVLTANSRAGLDWSFNIALCDRTMGRGECDPAPPTGKGYVSLSVNGTYEPLVGDWNGDGFDEPFWYRPGTGGDHRWISDGNEGFTATGVSIDAVAKPIVGDFDGNGTSDILWYVAGPTPDVVWWSAKSTDTTTHQINGTYQPLVGDFDGDGVDDIFWYAPGSAGDYLWFGATDRTKSVRGYTVNGTYQPMTGDFDGDGRTDLFWYAPGPNYDFGWYGRGSRTFLSKGHVVSGQYSPFIGDFDGDETSDIFWYRPGAGNDYVWSGLASKEFESAGVVVNGTYRPIVVDVDAAATTGGQDIIWYRSGTGTDVLWKAKADRTFASKSARIDGTYVPIVGNFGGTGAEDTIWYGPGTTRDAMWVS